MNYSQATISNYKLEIPKFKEVNYFIQNTSLPSVNMSGVDSAYQANQIQIPSNRIDYDPLSITFIVDEDLANYLTIFRWMQDISRKESAFDLTTDIVLHFLNTNKQIIRTATFYNGFPMTLGELSYDTSVADTTPLMCNAMFKYQYFEIL